MLWKEMSAMAENSLIEWTDHTFNPWVGCEKVSPACVNCYAEGWANRAGRLHIFEGSPPKLRVREFPGYTEEKI
jgi:protein gp37